MLKVISVVLLVILLVSNSTNGNFLFGRNEIQKCKNTNINFMNLFSTNILDEAVRMMDQATKALTKTELHISPTQIKLDFNAACWKQANLKESQLQFRIQLNAFSGFFSMLQKILDCTKETSFSTRLKCRLNLTRDAIGFMFNRCAYIDVELKQIQNNLNSKLEELNQCLLKTRKEIVDSSSDDTTDLATEMPETTPESVNDLS